MFFDEVERCDAAKSHPDQEDELVYEEVAKWNYARRPEAEEDDEDAAQDTDATDEPHPPFFAGNAEGAEDVGLFVVEFQASGKEGDVDEER